jgi:hypothetical protein
MRFLTLTMAALLLPAGAQDKAKKPRPWDQFGGGPERRNAHDGKLPASMSLVWKKEMGCAVPGRAQFVAGGGLLFGSSP